ncbi:hypothetical protein AB205_0205900 [Aquarana catesbeiana]|uniref:Uncharacterized protein n=1 Tax=Aquarana catesbeiana TaxID=8400 RepID=A0A2G9Q9N9_AQUCT|nr:hypothetical protein AB205_0205900 [Aquarana catesbeiana]
MQILAETSSAATIATASLAGRVKIVTSISTIASTSASMGELAGTWLMDFAVSVRPAMQGSAVRKTSMNVPATLV